VKWTIARRILTGFAVALGLAVISALIGFLALDRASDGYESALRVEQEVRLPANQALLAVRSANVQYLRYMVSPDPVFAARRDSSLAVADSILQLLEHTPLDTSLREVATEARGLATLWRAQVDSSFAALNAGNREVALRIRAERAQPTRSRLDAAVEGILARAAAHSEASADAARNAARGARSGLSLGMLAVLLAGLASAYLLNRAVSRPLQESSSVLAASTSEILAAASEQAAGANETMAAVAETVATVEEVTQTAQQSAERARAVADSAQRAADMARSGRKAADDSVNTMEAVRGQVESTAQSILTLAERAQAISEIISTVDDLADQTNLLALNAAVEAARAGEAGRGFGVVAGEVRALAEQSKRATVQVRQILGEIQRATNAAVMTTEQSTRQATAGSRQAGEAGETIRSLADAVADAAKTAAQIVASAGQQAVGIEQIRQAIANIQDATEQNLTAARQTEVAAQDLSQLGNRLVELVSGGNGRAR
jgi:methyl-accepting chemotaxis protein